jgi:mono/diheme cytochrome c family protein
MKKSTLYLLTLLTASCLLTTGRAAEGQGDKVVAGHDFALQVCAACHVVATDQKTAPILKPPAPRFAAIVRWPRVTEQFLREYLSSPHGNLGKSRKMPNPQLVDYQIDEVVAYLLSLKSGH